VPSRIQNKPPAPVAQRTPDAPQFMNLLVGPSRQDLGKRLWSFVDNHTDAEIEQLLAREGVDVSRFRGQMEFFEESSVSTPIKKAPERLYRVAKFVEVLRHSGTISPEVMQKLIGRAYTPGDMGAVDHFLYNAAFATVAGPVAAAAAGFAYDGIIQGIAKPAFEINGGMEKKRAWTAARANWGQVVKEDFQGAAAGPLARVELMIPKKKK
jgi:hypothetical protein